MADLTIEEARARVAKVEGAMGRLEAAVNVALVMCRLARLKRSLAALAAVALVLIALPVGAAAGCDWQAIEHASISIDAIPGGYRAVFMAGENCTISSEGPEVLPALDALLASMWCDWSASREA